VKGSEDNDDESKILPPTSTNIAKVQSPDPVSKGNTVTQIIQKWSNLTDLFNSPTPRINSNNDKKSQHSKVDKIKNSKIDFLNGIKVNNRNLDILSILRNYRIIEVDP
jgi:hypothetical protein